MSLPGPADVFAYDFMVRALVAGILVAFLCALLGVFTVLRGMGMISDGLGHVSFAGVAVGLLVGAFPLEFALVAAIVGAVAIQLLQERGLLKSDVAIGLVFTGGLALGIAIVSHGRGLGVNISSYLFGNILAVSAGDVQLVLALGALLAAATALFYKEFLYLTFNEEAARVSGLPVGALNLFFSILIGAGVALAARVVGVLLVSALIVVPAAAALQVARSFKRTLAAAAALGVVAVVVGLYLSFAVDIAAGAAIALVSIGEFAAAASWRLFRSMRSARARKTA
ncbi:MAG: metal ABC transporter permease [Euryarchaeota archaeon]|nr:metal ABC transporter permease [Euryarchaeota archaeon]